jgi:hypothetical protein
MQDFVPRLKDHVLYHLLDAITTVTRFFSQVRIVTLYESLTTVFILLKCHVSILQLTTYDGIKIR